MARTRLTAQDLNGNYPAAGSTLTWNAGDAVNGNDFIMTGAELLLAKNDNVGAQTITIDTVVNELGREADITAESIPPAGIRVFGPFTERAGWRQSDGTLHIDVADADVKLAVIKVR